NYGAIGDGRTISTKAIKDAIEDCNKSGGGRVLVPAGIYLSGAIHLKSNVNLHINKDATILFSKDSDDFLPIVKTRFEGVECMNYSPFIYSYGCENIAITGRGTLDGQAGNENWWSWKGKNEYGWEIGEPNGLDETAALYRMGEDNIPLDERIFGKGYELRTNFIQPYKCRNVLIDSITIKRSPMWVIHPVLCENVTVSNVSVNSHGPNNDGCNPESSKNVHIKDCYFDTGDDCIAIKSGRNAEGRRINVPSENIVIQNCVMKDGHGGVVIGSEMSGNVRNVFIEDCYMDSPNLERALRIKTNSLRGGLVENVYMRNCTIGEVSDAIIRINFFYSEGDTGNFTPEVRNIHIQNISSKKSVYALALDGYNRSPITDIYIEDCNFDGVEKGNILNNYTNLKFKNTFINGKPQ
ncbi:MAG: glycoside hydrolase family 28 protein, partial [Calditrichaceae bacterium]